MSMQESGSRFDVLAIVGVFLLMLAIRVTAPSDLQEGDQSKQVDYVLDIVCNGKWALQHHANGTMMTKPPLYNWLAAPLVMAFGPHEIWLRAPSALAGLGTALMLFDLARRSLGRRTALLSALILLLEPMFLKQFYFARTDMLLCFCITMQFWAIARWENARQRQAGETSARGWLALFWLGAAVGNFTKGPVAMLLPHMVLSVWWLLERRWAASYARLGIAWGLPLAILPAGGWLYYAWRLEGKPVIDALIYGEMVDRFRAGSKSHEFHGVFWYIPYMLARPLPWSIFALAAICPARRTLRSEPASPQASGVRLFACWLLVIFVFFSLIPSKRVDRLFPVIPALCALAGFAIASIRTDQRALFVRGAAYLLAVVFGVAGMALLLTQTEIAVIRLDPEFLAKINAGRGLVIAAGIVCVVCAAISIVAQRAFAQTGLLLCALAAMTLHQHVFCEWKAGTVPPEAVAFCHAVREKARQQHAPILVISQPKGLNLLRYFLLVPRAKPPEEIADAVDAIGGPCCVVGAAPFGKTTARLTGTLEAAGLVPPERLRPVRETLATRTTGAEPLAAVFFEKK